jgi:3-isopropylmalate/(R)-2-methylmalate dehydratase small subunit
MSQIKIITGRALPLVGDDIDTDRIIPARFLRCVTFDGLGEQVFADDRQQLQGKHPFDLPQYQGAKILLVNGNFGCGSSREHAPQAITRWGITAIIGESFAEIFFGNCLANGIPCLTAAPDSVKALQKLVSEQPQSNLEINLESLEVRSGEMVTPLGMGEGARQMLVRGTWDSCGQLIQNLGEIQETAAKLPYMAWNLG